VPLAVRAEALQTYMDKPVVFARFDDIYEVRMIEIGARDNDWLEVLGGIEPGTTYVTANSFLVKADILKSGASHAH
jgi:cobalt-zinc-cadmium efflux system membrane fusion protein